MTTTIGIVTVLFNSDDVLPGFFASLAKQVNIKYRLYVIDNSKTDSGSLLSRQLANLHDITAEIVFNNANLGVAKGNNQGIELARKDSCEYVLLSNNDIEFYESELISKLVEEMREKKFSAITPKIYYFGMKKKIWFAGGCFSRLKATTPHYGDGEDDIGQYDTLSTIEYSPTCFLLINSSVFESIGMMDEKYFVYYDDSDFLWRMKENNLKVGFAHARHLWHKVSYSTGGSISDFSLYYGSRNRILFIRKNYGPIMQIASLSYFLTTRLLKIMSFGKKQRSSMIRGVIDGLKMS